MPLVPYSKRCPFCGQDNGLMVDEDALAAWESGVHAQVAFAHLSADDREAIISGAHSACWDEFVPEED